MSAAQGQTTAFIPHLGVRYGLGHRGPKIASVERLARTKFPSWNCIDRRTYYRAFQTHDARFDGRVFVGVTSTGIYCRPICPARTPKFENCRFFASAAAAQEAGFRPCLRCRPEIAPDLAFWRGTSNTVSRALALIADGALDGEDGDVEALAERLGVGGRQLRRLFQQHLGASPIAVAQTRRVLFAKQLLHDTHLPMAEVALAVGLRQRAPLQRDLPRAVRPAAQRAAPQRRRRQFGARGRDAAARLPAALRLAGHAGGPVVARGAAASNGSTTTPGIAASSSTASRARVAVAHLPARNSVMVTIRFPCVKALPAIVARVRRVFDLGADIATIGSHLARDPKLAPLIAKRPGLRAPGDWERETMAVIARQRAAGLAAVARLCRATSQDGQPWLNPSPCWSTGCRRRSANC